MYLKSLELQGFKSFPDRIKLDFNKGITAVVGPNGSGKSNIGDAVRWVLGEQSSKTLRGAKMEDIIFAGTQSRKPMGYAKVTLCIDNSDRTLNVDSDEAYITRSLDRSGDSEYLINGKNCRLKDVTELFMDTGMGRDGYSIIGQGRIAEIVSAKSGERRDIFEEAAGISKSRARKEESERRLAAAEENILRLKDIVSALEARIEPLRKQSEKAAEFISLSERKKILDITVWVDQYKELKKVLEELEDKILINSGEYSNIEADIERTEQRMQQLTRDMQSSRIKIDELQQKIRDTEAADSKINADIAVCENEIKHCEENIAEYKKRIEDAENSDLESNEKIKNKLAEKKENEQNISENIKNIALTEKELSSLISEEKVFNKEFEGESSALNELYIARSKHTAAIETNRKSIDDIKAQSKLSKNQLDELKNSLAGFDKEKTDVENGIKLLNEKNTDENNRLSGLTRLLEAKDSGLEAAEKEYRDSTLKIKETEQKLSFLTSLENSMEGFNNAVRQVLRAEKNHSLRGIHGTVSHILKVDGKYSAAIETALGGALQNIITENEECAKEAIRFLKETKGGRATFLPITSVNGYKLNNPPENEDGFIALACDLTEYDEKYRGIVYSLLGRIAVCEDLDCASDIARKFGYKFKIVTLDGQVINAGGSYTGGSMSKSAGVLSRKTEIDKLNKDKEELDTKISELRKKRDRLKAESDKLHFDSEAIKERITTVKSDLIRFEAEQKRIETVKQQTEKQILAVTGQSDIIEKRIAGIRSDIADSEKRLEEINKAIGEKERTTGEKSEKMRTISEKRTALSQRLSELNISKAELAKDSESIAEEIRRIEEQRRILGDDSAQLAVLIDGQLKNIEEKKAEIEGLKTRLDSSKDIIESLNSGISDTKSKSFEKEAENTELRRKSRELSDMKEKTAAERIRLDERKKSVIENSDEIIRSMEEQYEVYLSEAENLALKDGKISEYKSELAEIKQKIRSLGSVNVAAIEEYKEVSENYRNMSEQLDDVVSSKNKLEKIIADLTESMKTRFSESFVMINDNFKRIFTELFGGGKAELIMTDPDNVLESGIEINVAPPGKVIKSLSLLSGGEQAFVAIALYFAILYIKPAPFCILDEIEAALDDVNVARYAEYLRHYTDTTQFIAVTHRRGTMEEADVLYGVTMQQKGISKLIKLDQPPKEDINDQR